MIQKIEANITPVTKPEREEAIVFPVLNLNCCCFSEIKSLERSYSVLIFFIINWIITY